ncbi:60S acidic ribosomal protein P1 [Thelohanellus kitauei]|uniref:Large ribosomal subunit protein P2 n=1 Tax=Thelohanellus kitauei TaxID=669202 RepID=A0A0C2N9U2_THEKT|nr:60S acidic ribosomal protein P1 [Thelohanellus kitauei]
MVSQEAEADLKSCVYASLVILDSKKEVTPERLGNVLKASKVDVEPYWLRIFSNAISGCSAESLLTMTAISPAAAASTASPSAQVQETKATVAKKEESEDSDSSGSGGGLGDLFD